MFSEGRWHRILTRARSHPLVIIWIVCSVAVVLPIWTARVLPMLDVPNHLAQVRAWHDHAHPSWNVGAYYDVRIRIVPYMLYHCLVDVLLYVMPIEAANKVCLSVDVLLYPLALRALARALGRSEWLALAGFILAYNQNFIYGFVSYLLGSCFLFFGLAAVLRFLDHGRHRDLLILGASGILTFLGHVLPYALFGVMTAVLVASEPRNWRRGAAALAALVPALVVGAVSFRGEHASGPFLYDSLHVVATWRDLSALAQEFPRRILDLFPGQFDMAILVVVAASTLALVSWRGVGGDNPEARLGTRRLLILIAVALVAYRALPFSIDRPMRWWFIAARMPSVLAALLVLLPGRRFIGRETLAFAPIVGAALVLSLHLTVLYRDFARRNADFFALLAKVPRGANTLVAVAHLWGSPNPGESSGDPASSAPVYWHWAEWATALKGGYSPYLFDVGFPVVPKPERALQAPAFGNWDGFRPSSAPAFDYYLIQHPVALSDPCCEVVAARSQWALLHRIR